MEKVEKVRHNVTLGIGHADRSISKSVKWCMDFTVKTYGNTTIIDYGNTVNRYIDGYSSGNGYHLCQMVYAEVKKRVESGEYVPIEQDNNRIHSNFVCFNPANIDKFLNKKTKAFDIKRCYWDTSKKLGVISQELYNYGLNNKSKNKKKKYEIKKLKKGVLEIKLINDWKAGRNASIGSLGAVIYERVYKNGELVEVKEPYRRPFNNVRLDIVDYVWNLANSIISQVKDDFLMYLTDCFFVTSEVADNVIKLLKENGYEYSVKDVIITSMRRGKSGSGAYFIDRYNNDEPLNQYGLHNNHPSQFGEHNIWQPK